jgi:hypothetical protein
MDDLSNIPKAKPGPKPLPKLDVPALLARIDTLEAKNTNLEQLIIRIGHQMGISHQLLIAAGLEPYQPTKNDMSKFKKVG